MRETKHQPASAGMPTRPDRSVRRTPAQFRSRERVDRILEAAAALIGEKGSDRATMSEVATTAGMSIGALYQYFPDKAAIILALAEQYHESSRRCIAVALGPVTTTSGLRNAFAALFDEYYRLFRAQPVLRDVLSGMQADKRLAAFELAESRACGAMLAAAMRRAQPDIEVGNAELIAFLLWQLGEAAMRLAISLDPAQGDAVVEAFKRMALREITEPAAAHSPAAQRG